MWVLPGCWLCLPCGSSRWKSPCDAHLTARDVHAPCSSSAPLLNSNPWSLVTLSQVLSVPCIPSFAPSSPYSSSSSSAVCLLLSSLCIQKKHPFSQPAVHLGSSRMDKACKAELARQGKMAMELGMEGVNDSLEEYWAFIIIWKCMKKNPQKLRSTDVASVFLLSFQIFIW